MRILTITQWFLKWGGLALCASLTIAALGSAFWSFYWDNGNQTLIRLDRGNFFAGHT